jgi:two-component system chemotaxis response regulator CheY
MTVSSQRVLVVDDSPTMRAFVVAALESDGFEVTAAKSGFEALKILPGASFHLIVTDVNMPDINGLELVRYVRNSAAHKATPLIIISTDGRDKDRDRGMQLGASAYLVKPFQPDALLNLARTVMAPGADIAPLMVHSAGKKPH